MGPGSRLWGRRGARRGRIAAALLAAIGGIVMSGASYAAAAQLDPGDPPPTRAVRVEIEVDMDPIDICVGDSVVVKVQIHRVLKIGVPNKDGSAGFHYEPQGEYMLDPQFKAQTMSPSIASSAETSRDGDPLPAFYYTITGKKVGSTHFVIQTRVPDPWDEYLKTPLAGSTNAKKAVRAIDVTVNDCNMNVSAITNFSAAKLAQVRGFQGQMPTVTLTSSADGAYSGEGTLSWTEAIHDSTCASVWTKSPVLKTPAHITATVGKDTVTIGIAFDSVMVPVCGACNGGSACFPGDAWEYGSISAVFPSAFEGSMTVSTGRFEITLEKGGSNGQS